MLITLNPSILAAVIAVSHLTGADLVPQDQGNSTKEIECSAVVPASVADVWRAYTTTEGIKSWMVAEGSVDLKIGGLMRTAYKPGTDLAGPNAIWNKIISYDPEHMMTIQCVHTPESFPFKRAIANAWTVVYFQPEGTTNTRVTCRMLGFDDSVESTKMREFFRVGNQYELGALVKHFKQ